MINIGSSKIAEMYVGSTKIAQAYVGSTKVYELNKKPYFVFEFSVSDFVPTTNLLNGAYRNYSTWTQVSSSPNRWKLELSKFGMVFLQGVPYFGLCFLFSNQSSGENPGFLQPSLLGGGTCKLIDSGNLDITDSNNVVCESMDRMFANCTGLTYIAPLHCSNVQNVGGMFSGCTEVTEGALAQYTWFSTYGININNHSGTFTNCGSNTQTGTAELAQIPTTWGGTMIPASTEICTNWFKSGSRSDGTYWFPSTVNDKYNIDFSTLTSLQLFTNGSMSQYTGVNMRKSNIGFIRGTFTTSAACYYWPCFFQYKNGSMIWCIHTQNYNGTLSASQSAGDMPGTLDYESLGTLSVIEGTFDSTAGVIFAFVVTNTSDASDILTNYGILYNGYFNTDPGLRFINDTVVPQSAIITNS